MATPFQDELLALEKSLAGFHPTHYIRESLIAKIAEVKVKIEERQSDYRYADFGAVTIEQVLEGQKKALAGYGSGHYMVGVITERIIQLQERIDQKKTRN